MCEDEAGPYQAIPQSVQSWQDQGCPERIPHEYIRQGTAKMLTVFHPKTGYLVAKGVTRTTNAVLHPWILSAVRLVLKTQVNGVSDKTAEKEVAKQTVKPATTKPSHENRGAYERWQEGLSIKFTLPEKLPVLRGLLILDNLAGHKTPTFVLDLLALGVMPLYTPLGGSWLNMGESVQRIIVRRCMAGNDLISPEAIIDALEATVRGWNTKPTAFVWGGKRKARRERAKTRKLRRVGGSRAYAIDKIDRKVHLQNE